VTEEQFRLYMVLLVSFAFVLWTVALLLTAGTLANILHVLRDMSHHWISWHRYEVTEREHAKAKRGGA
jgi:hypothetical protein